MGRQERVGEALARIGARVAAAVLAGLCLFGGPARAEWVPLRDTSLVVAPGSPLDFSAFAAPVPAGEGGRVVTGPSGHLAFASRPDRPVRFLCAALGWSAMSGNFPDHATADLYAAQLRVHGYNLARFHFVDFTLMNGEARDFDYNPEQLDRFRYVLAALKREGIHWIFDGMSSPQGALGDPSPERWEHGDLKLAVHFDPAARRHWSRLVETLYGSVNPYTGLAPLKDPSLALVVLVNENNVEFDAMAAFGRDRRAYPAKLLPQFNRWLGQKYGATAALRAAWPDLGAAERIETGTVAFPESWDARGPRMRDTQLFIRSLESDTTRWMTAEIRKLGYPGLTTQYNVRTNTALSFSRAALPVVAQNTYFDEVDDFSPGATITQKSSLDDAVGYLRDIMGTRWLGRPFVVTEWGQVFWNRFRHEAGIAVPAYAALQGWDAIDQHSAGPVDIDYAEPYPFKRHLLPYVVGLDPVARASETLAALLFRRGDAAEASGTVAVPFGAPGDMLGDGRDPVPDEVTTLGLVTRIGLAPPDLGPDGRQPDLTIPLSEVGGGGAEGGAARLGRVLAWLDGASDDAANRALVRLEDRVSALRGAGVLEASNRTDVARGVFQSQTGQIVLDRSERSIAVVTPRTEAVSFVAVPRPRRLGALTVEAASGPATVAASALDGASLDGTDRILLVVATDAMNTDMTFRDAQRRTLESWGHFPVLIERQTVRIRLAVPEPSRWHLSSLHLDGSPGDDLPLGVDDASIIATIDNAATSHGPTTYFYLERR